MGACASKPKDLDTEDVPAPVEAPVIEVTPVISEKIEVETEAKEVKDGDEPLVDISEAAPETTGEKKVVAEAVANKVEAIVEEAKEEKKEVAETVATA